MSKDKVKCFLINYLEKETLPTDLWSMSKKWIVELAYNQFKKEDYSKGEIENILNEILLEEESHFIETDASFKIVYPKSKREKVKKYWSEHALIPYQKSTVAVVLWLVLLVSTFLIFPEYTSASLFIPAILVIGYFIFDYTYKTFEKNFRILNRNKLKFVLSYVGGIGLSFLFLIGANFMKYSTFSNNQLLVYGFASGVALGALFYKLFSKDV